MQIYCLIPSFSYFSIYNYETKPQTQALVFQMLANLWTVILQDITSVLAYGSKPRKKGNILVEVNEIQIGDIWSFSIPMYCIALLEHHYWLVLLKGSCSLINTSKNHGIGWILISDNSHGKILSIPSLDINLHHIKEGQNRKIWCLCERKCNSKAQSIHY